MSNLIARAYVRLFWAIPILSFCVGCGALPKPLPGPQDGPIPPVPAPTPNPTPNPAPAPDPSPTPAPDPSPNPNPNPASPPNPAGTPIASSANSITATLAGPRTDPEGQAPPAARTTLVTWKDSSGADRTMTLDAYLYQYNFTFSDNLQTVARSANDDAYGHPGFGYVVSHNSLTGNSPLGKVNAPTSIQTTVFSGGHHAIHRIELTYDRDKEGGGYGIRIPVVIEWLVATGRDHPVWSVTWKMDQASNPNNVNFNEYRMDVRGPYGSLNWDGAASRAQGDAIGGVAWGDSAFKFTTTDAQLTLNSPWTYNAANTVNFGQAWTQNVNAEMGIIQTRPLDRQMPYAGRVAAHERGHISAEAYAGKADCAADMDNRNYIVPCVNGWPYQLMNYDWSPGSGKPAAEATGTKLIAWGAPYGWLGASDVDQLDTADKADGRGDRSYATFIVLGPHARYNPATGVYDQDGDVAQTVKAVEALAAATIDSVTPGAIALELPKGPAATQTKRIANGYNDTYAAYTLTAENNAVAFTFTPAPGRPVQNPIFIIRNCTLRQLPKIAIAGAPITTNTGAPDSGAFVSMNESANELWITLNQTIRLPTPIHITP